MERVKTLVFTGGHHTSALEVAKALKDEGWNIVWFGHRHSMWKDKSDSAEYQEVTATGIKFYDLLAGKFYRTYNPLKLLRIPLGFIQAFVWLVQIQPSGIVSFGGYLAVPTVICGWILGIPSITHEQTIVAGWANKVVAKFSQKIALTWPESAKYYPPSKTIVTGLPLRPGIVSIKSNILKTQDSKLKTIFITGGKQGSHTINNVVFESVDKLTKDFNVIHQVGNSMLFEDLAIAKSLNLSNYKFFAYSSQQQLEAFVKADIVVTRGGAHSIYELGYLGKKCVVIPIPWVSHDEQSRNAEILQRNHLGVIIPQSTLSTSALISAIKTASKLQGKPLDLPNHAVESIVQLIKQQFV